MGREKHYWLLVIAVLVGAVARAIAVADQPLWADVALTLVLVEWPAKKLLLAPVDATGPLYYLLHKLLIADGASVAAIRSISLAAGIASIPAIYALGRLCVGRGGALLAAGMLALSFPLVDYSQEARCYSLLVMLVLLSACGLNGWVSRSGAAKPPVAYLGLFAVSTLCAFYTHLTSVFWIIPAVAGGGWLTLRRGSNEARRLYLLAAVLMAVMALSELNRLIAASHVKIGFTWLAQADFWLFLETVADAWLPPVPGDPPWRGAAAIGLLVVTLVLVGWRMWKRSPAYSAWAKERPAAVLTIATLVSAPLWIWLFGFVDRPIFMPRTILISISGFILLIALVVQVERAWRGGAAVLALYAAALLAGGTTRQKEDWSAVSNSLASAVRQGDLVMVCPEWKYPAFRHALNKPFPAPLAFPFGSDIQLIEARLGHGSRSIRNFFEIGFSRDGWSGRRVSLASPSRVWLVASECGQMPVIRQWLGQSSWRKVSSAPGGRQHKAIDLWLIDGIAQRPRPIVVFARDDRRTR